MDSRTDLYSVLCGASKFLILLLRQTLEKFDPAGEGFPVKSDVWFIVLLETTIIGFSFFNNAAHSSWHWQFLWRCTKTPLSSVSTRSWEPLNSCHKLVFGQHPVEHFCKAKVSCRCSPGEFPIPQRMIVYTTGLETNSLRQPTILRKKLKRLLFLSDDQPDAYTIYPVGKPENTHWEDQSTLIEIEISLIEISYGNSLKLLLRCLFFQQKGLLFS